MLTVFAHLHYPSTPSLPVPPPPLTAQLLWKGMETDAGVHSGLSKQTEATKTLRFHSCV